jgi:glycosyltransferase involved in cell wall biosynthesis
VPEPQVSVLLPARDAAATLDAAIRSALATREPRIEVICVDDGSSDGTAEQIERWVARDPRVRGVRSAPRGLVAALNLGLARARAPLVARLDADDEMHPERLAAQRALLQADPGLALVGCRVESFREGGLAEGYRLYTDWTNRLVSPEQIEKEAFVECPVPHPTWMFRRRLVLELGGYRERPWPEDLDLLYRLLARGWRMAKVPRVLYRWRDHAGRLSRTDPRYDKRAFLRAKAHFLAQLHPMQGAVVWGAGPTGRRLVKLLEAEGLRVRALIDVNPARIGTEWRGLPILSPSDLAGRAPAWRQEGLKILGAVASRGAREEIRSALGGLGLEEGGDFLMVA